MSDVSLYSDLRYCFN